MRELALLLFITAFGVTTWYFNLSESQFITTVALLCAGYLAGMEK